MKTTQKIVRQCQSVFRVEDKYLIKNFFTKKFSGRKIWFHLIIIFGSKIIILVKNSFWVFNSVRNIPLISDWYDFDRMLILKIKKLKSSFVNMVIFEVFPTFVVSKLWFLTRWSKVIWLVNCAFICAVRARKARLARTARPL